MGLDMYLERKIYIGGKYDWNEVEGDFNIYRKGNKLPLQLKDVKYITEEVCYWRKANAIHCWFVKNVQNGEDDCRTYDVSRDKLEELLNICKEIKEKCPLKDGQVRNGQRFDRVQDKWIDIIEEGQVMTNTEVAEELLPTQEGFFFGSVDYDEYYYEDICRTIDSLEKILKEDDELGDKGYWVDYQYTSSW